MKKLATYKNGNTLTTIYSDGTKTHFTMDDEFKFEFPESHDISISQCCDNGCEWCYYGCSPTGKHGKLTGWNFFDSMRPYTEIAINLQYPMPDDLFSFLFEMHRRKIIVNVTVNQNHFMKYDIRKFLREAIGDGLIKGVGISLTDPTQDGFIDMVKQYPNTVIHVIAGVTPWEDIQYLMGHGLKLLILGYKKTGRGKKYYDGLFIPIITQMKYLEGGLDEVINGFKVVSFDNLAIEQLHIKDRLSEKEWEMFYGGDDGTVTFFIDLVKGVFARNSLSQIVYPIGDKTIDEMFEIIKKEKAIKEAIMKNKKTTKLQKVLEHLQENGAITSIEAIDLYGATRLSAIIYNLRKKGYIIETKMLETIDRYGNPCHYGRYILHN